MPLLPGYFGITTCPRDEMNNGSEPTVASPTARFDLAGPGAYALALLLESDRVIRIGKLGCFSLTKGCYVYVGSALGPGGVAARLRHHCRETSRPRWHLDYLRQHATPCGAWIRFGTENLECQWASALRAQRLMTPGPAGFGSSDCRCAGHLFFAGTYGISKLHGSLARILAAEVGLDTDALVFL